MHIQAKPARDEFTFSLQGMAAVNSFVFPPAIPHDGINRAWDVRLGGTATGRASSGRAGKSHRVEAFLARYFAPGHCCCDAA